MSAKDRTTYRKRQASVLETFDPKTYRVPGVVLDNQAAGGGIYGTLTRAQYMERREDVPDITFTDPRTTNHGEDS